MGQARCPGESVECRDKIRKRRAGGRNVGEGTRARVGSLLSSRYVRDLCLFLSDELSTGPIPRSRPAAAGVTECQLREASVSASPRRFSSLVLACPTPCLP